MHTQNRECWIQVTTILKPDFLCAVLLELREFNTWSAAARHHGSGAATAWEQRYAV